MQFKKIAFFVISATILFTGCDSKKEEEQEVKKEVVKKEQTKFKLTTTNNAIIDLEKTKDGIIFKGLEGKVVLLNFWATWCPPCRAEIPHLNNLKNKYKDTFEIVSLAMGEKDGNMTSVEKMNNFIEEYKINYPIANTKENFLVSKAMGEIKSIPTMFIINPMGKIVQKYVGVVPQEMMELDINRALGK
ncbi:TlpA disulfide reductase family protein [Arcobacter sp. LA11]|uniref:TlpA family protein disulfide reductase n=1 Tax=Arcobacter sp. LA11 TaxID=1898176 RepID=UPI000933627E|nr:TlpA disulfide reductase family protein [Arcobacter sp. LA11]